MRALQRDVRGGVRVAHLDHIEPARTGLKTHLTGDAETGVEGIEAGAVHEGSVVSGGKSRALS